MEGLYSQSQSYEEKKYFTRNLIVIHIRTL
jgi:hypothetical protein